MKYKIIVTSLIFIVIAFLVVGCVGQELPAAEEEKTEEMRDAENAVEEADNGSAGDQVTEGIDENEVSEDSNLDKATAELPETETADSSETDKAQEFRPTANPYQSFNQARNNMVPIVLKFYSET